VDRSTAIFGNIKITLRHTLVGIDITLYKRSFWQL